MTKTMNVSLPESMSEFVQTRVKSEQYATTSAYIQTLIRADQKKTAQERLELLLLEGLDSGEPIEVTPAHLDDLKSRLRQRLQKRA